MKVSDVAIVESGCTSSLGRANRWVVPAFRQSEPTPDTLRYSSPVRGRPLEVVATRDVQSPLSAQWGKFLM